MAGGRWMKENLLLVLTIGSVLLGAVLGFVLRNLEPSPQTIVLVNFPGEILMNMAENDDPSLDHRLSHIWYGQNF